jgi:hypothetical protein
LTGAGLARGKQEQSVETLALVTIRFLLEKGFQFISALGDTGLLTMHSELLRQVTNKLQSAYPNHADYSSRIGIR